MIVQFAIINDLNQKSPVGVVVHPVGERPRWVAPSVSGNSVFKVLFSRSEVFGNIPDGFGGFTRVTKTWADEDFLDFAVVKVNLPLFITVRGRWDSNMTDSNEILKYLGNRYLEDA